MPSFIPPVVDLAKFETPIAVDLAIDPAKLPSLFTPPNKA